MYREDNTAIHNPSDKESPDRTPFVIKSMPGTKHRNKHTMSAGRLTSADIAAKKTKNIGIALKIKIYVMAELIVAKNNVKK